MVKQLTSPGKINPQLVSFTWKYLHGQEFVSKIMKRAGLLLTMNILSVGLCAQGFVPLYDTIPNSIPASSLEHSEASGRKLKVRHVSVPGLTIYQPVKKSEKRTVIIICPGGGYSYLAESHEGTEVAAKLASWGITAVVLRYRLPNDSIMINRSIGPLQDAQRALQLVRKNALQWDINPQKVGIMGFSAEGHLAASASTHFDDAVISNPEEILLRPDFSVLIYPVISFTDSLMHAGSRNKLIGKSPTQNDIQKFSNELQVNIKTPPAFLVHASNDKVVKPENSLHYYRALKKNNISAELKMYPGGGHGFGLHNTTTTDEWIQHLKQWLINNDFL